MKPKICHLTASDYAVSRWSGGSTTQIAIAPEGSLYADRTFLWRLSSATVEIDESNFTLLPDYHRLIAPLRGEMVLTHDGGNSIELAPYEVHAFDGGAATHSRGRCVDFNLMLRKGSCEGSIRPVRMEERGTLSLSACREPVGGMLILYCVEGSGTLSIGVETVLLSPTEAALIRQPGAAEIELSCPGAAVFMEAVVSRESR